MGQELCVLEAMKMKNAIRAPRRGTIGRVHGQLGADRSNINDLLVEFKE